MELMTRPDLPTASKDKLCCGYAHFAISLGHEERVREFTETLGHKGVVVKSKPRHTGNGYYESTVVDPDGNLIELTT